MRLRPLTFATFLVWRLRIGACGVGACGVGACGVGACGFWRLWPNFDCRIGFLFGGSFSRLTIAQWAAAFQWKFAMRIPCVIRCSKRLADQITYTSKIFISINNIVYEPAGKYPALTCNVNKNLRKASHTKPIPPFKNRSNIHARFKNRLNELVSLKNRPTFILILFSWSLFQTYPFTWSISETPPATCPVFLQGNQTFLSAKLLYGICFFFVFFWICNGHCCPNQAIKCHFFKDVSVNWILQIVLKTGVKSKIFFFILLLMSFLT